MTIHRPQDRVSLATSPYVYSLIYLVYVIVTLFSSVNGSSPSIPPPEAVTRRITDSEEGSKRDTEQS